MPQPKVTVILVAPKGRDGRAERAIEDFLAQTYEPIELVVATDDLAVQKRVHRHLKQRKATDRVSTLCQHYARTPINRESLLNGAADMAKGDLLCYWEPDDRQHPDRTAVQVASVQGAGSCLGELLYHFPGERSLYWVDFALGPPTGCGGVAPSAIMHWRKAHARPGDDVAFFQQVAAAGPVAAIRGRPHLSIRTCDRDHPLLFRMQLDVRGRSRAVASVRGSFLGESLAGYRGLPALTVKGHDGDAFAYDPSP